LIVTLGSEARKEKILIVEAVIHASVVRIAGLHVIRIKHEVVRQLTGRAGVGQRIELKQIRCYRVDRSARRDIRVCCHNPCRSQGLFGGSGYAAKNGT
jgi:hypothetical protein